ncbi:chitinase-like protein Idgf2 isoform X3 [Drosophila sulfurigaster albostrigata]|uniref:chitinase-like protein Idgf2 isoform X3 n=1 Tax=Drosophila sulfurigaster albostrigata TaxID=89887 RepID=UPI002D21B0D6|nr:chitinase-like protein Idgf2 isoform X3 [Drosophila sulfurigaster albostrigata]
MENSIKVLALILLLPLLYVPANGHKIVCYYDSASSLREPPSQLTTSNLALALRFCTHLIYGYAGIRADNFLAHSLNEELDINQHQFTEVTALKRHYPNLKVLLSVGGDHDIDGDHPNKYIELLEGGIEKQTEFIKSAHSLVKNYGFDGLDLAYQFPKNKPKKVHTGLAMIWKSFKKIFTGDFIVDPDADQHKNQFTSLVRSVKDKLHQDGFLLTLTVLPNVNSTWYFDVPVLNNFVDFVNIAAFDFVTPERNPEEADYTAPLFNEESQERLSHYNADFQAQYWLHQGFDNKKINLGIPSYGNAWKLTEDSGETGKPIVSKTNGPAPPGPYLKKEGVRSLPEICLMLAHSNKPIMKDDLLTSKINKYGSYVISAKDSNTERIWVSYDNFDAVSFKTAYSKIYLGGVALFDLGYDDFQGSCFNEKFPILHTIKQQVVVITKIDPII